MTVAARGMVFLVLISIAPMAYGEQIRGGWADAPPALLGTPTVTYRAASPGPLVLPPPPPLVAHPVQVGPVVTYRPLVPVVPMPSQYYVGQGLLGQPKLYVPAQPVRNFLRYLSP